MPENGVVSLIIKANEDESKPYFLILDEMNLSHVERYFADFLSVMESKDGKGFSLHSGSNSIGSNGGKIPASLPIPQNLFIIGTVNIDETTYMFSPKVLDRANVIEFRVSEEEMTSYLQATGKFDPDGLTGEGSKMAGDFLVLAKKESEISDSEKYSKILMSFFTELQKTGAEFGYRTASEIMRFIWAVKQINSEWIDEDIIDAAIMQKLLPKVHGSRRRLTPVLETLAKFCLAEELPSGLKMEDLLNPKENKMVPEIKIKYLLSHEKISRMYINLIHNGFTSYAEA